MECEIADRVGMWQEKTVSEIFQNFNAYLEFRQETDTIVSILVAVWDTIDAKVME